MKKKFLLAAGILLSLTVFGANSKSNAAAVTHKVSAGETYWKIAKGFGIPINNLEAANQHSPLYSGANIVLPNSPISIEDKKLLACLVHAEAGGEPYAGKVAVAEVVFNRVKSSQFPDTVHGVIFQETKGHYAFEPVQNGRINEPADDASKKAVNEAIALIGQGNGSLYFYNPEISTSSWIFSRPIITRIGHHVFAK